MAIRTSLSAGRILEEPVALGWACRVAYWFTCVVLAVGLLAAPAQAAAPTPDAQLEACLKLGGSNRPQLEQALDWAYAQNPEGGFAEHTDVYGAMCLLLEYSPAVDLGVVTAEQLIENVELAYQARREFAYCSAYEDWTFINYVLPMRVSQEPLSSWRRYLYDQLKDKVRDCQTLGEAATIVGQYYSTLATYKPTQNRDQSPLATIKGGYGRCEELVILFIDCCRAVGIPARMAYCPYWTHCDDNHAWWEVLGNDMQWHMDPPYDEHENREASWVAQAAHQAPIVIAVGLFGITGCQPDDWDREPRCESTIRSGHQAGALYAMFNTTPNYRQTGDLIVRAWPETQLENQQPDSPPAYLTLSIFNYGALRQVARLPFFQGYARIDLGVGDYILSTILPDGPRTALVHITAGETLVVIWSALPEAPNDFVLYFPKDPPPVAK